MAKRILIFNVNWLGDVLFSTPVIRNIRYNFSDSFIACIIPRRCLEVLEGNPYLDEIIIFDQKGEHRGVWGFWKFVALLKKKKFDTVYLLHRSFTRACICWLAGIKERIGHYTGKRGFLLTKKIPAPGITSVHRIDYYLDVIGKSGLKVKDRYLDFPVSEADISAADDFLKEQSCRKEDFIVGINPGGNWNPKRWLQESIAGLSDKLAAEFDAKVIITGGTSDLPLAQEIAAMTKYKPIIACGQLTLKQFGALARRLNVFITADTGPLHVANASGAKKIIALFGPTHPGITGPYPDTNVTVISKDAGCIIPCYVVDCPDNRCMKAITAEDVMQVVRKSVPGANPKLCRTSGTPALPIGPGVPVPMKVNKILFITLSNIGDVILTLPALDYLRNKFPRSAITVISGSRPQEIFRDNPRVDKLIVYDKRAGLKENIRLFRELKKQEFDVIVDLRNTMFGVFLPAQYKTSPFQGIPRSIPHMKDRHLYKVRSMFGEHGQEGERSKPESMYISPQDEEYIDTILKNAGINKGEKFLVVSPGARSHIKRWTENGFAGVIEECIRRFGAKIVLVGDKAETGISKNIIEKLPTKIKHFVTDVTGKTSICQLASLLKRTNIFITNDSANLHLAGYLNVPTVAIFGPTDEAGYGPWSAQNAVVKKDIFCRPCSKAQCRYGTLDCMRLVTAGDVMRQVEKIMVRRAEDGVRGKRREFKRILIVRTDRIGDVLLSTPVIQALRKHYPTAYIAMMVGPYAKEIVEGNPYLDEVILLDKDKRHKSWLASMKFALFLKKKKFDAAFILHPTNRVHTVTFFAGIPRRIGYDRKLGFLLTDKIPHLKQFGQKHEKEYNLDIVRHAGIEPGEAGLYMPIKDESEAWVDKLLKEQGIEPRDTLLAIHPSSSCISRRWPVERFAQAADRLVEKYSFKVLVVAGSKDAEIARKVIGSMRSRAINLVGKTTVSQLASLLKRCRLFISNDSGPVHIASAVGVPVISIFGRNQKGLSPRRWGPLGKHDRFLHKDIGCKECLAHNCKKGFACLNAITVEEVVRVADELLSGIQSSSCSNNLC